MFDFMNKRPHAISQNVKSLILPSSCLVSGLNAVGGLEKVKRELITHIVMPLRHPQLFFGSPHRILQPARGVLLHGPPGTGKTMLARAVATESSVPLIALHAAALESKWYGESPKLLQEVFQTARSLLAPCIIFFDEVDGLGRARNDSDQSCVYSLKCELLRNMDGIDTDPTASVMTIACTNNIRSLDKALQRRFQRIIYVDRPNENERLDILKKIVCSDSSYSTIKKVACATDGMTGSDLESLYKRVSAYRMANVDLRRMLAKSTDSDQLAKALGKLTWNDWKNNLI